MNIFMLSKFKKGSPPNKQQPPVSLPLSKSESDKNIQSPKDNLLRKSRLVRWIPKELPQQPCPKDQLLLEIGLKTAKETRNIEQNYNYLTEFERKELEQKKLELDLRLAKARLAKEYAESLTLRDALTEDIRDTLKSNDKPKKEVKKKNCHKCVAQGRSKIYNVCSRCETYFYKFCCKFFCCLSLAMIITLATILIAF